LGYKRSKFGHVFSGPPSILYFVVFLVFTSEPEDRFIIVGSKNITIPCHATSSKDGKLTILWKHNSTYITDYDNKHFRQIGQGSLFFIQFLQRDVGDYQCTVIRSILTDHKEQVSSKKARIQAACKYFSKQ